MRKKILALISCTAALIFGWALYQYQSTPLMTISPAQVGSIRAKVSATGYIRSESPIIISSRIDGLLNSVNYKAGDRVKKNSIAATIDSRDITIELEKGRETLNQSLAEKNQLTSGAKIQEIRQAQFNLEQAQEVLKQAKRDFDRFSAIYEEGGVPLEDLEKAQLEFNSADKQYKIAKEQLNTLQAGPTVHELKASDAQVKQAQTAVKSLQNKLVDTIIKSPVDGTILKCFVEKGSYVQPGASLYEVVDNSAPKVEAEVDEKDIWNVQLGQIAAISGKTLGGQEFAGKVSKIAPIPKNSEASENEEVKYLVTVRLDKPDPRLRFGLTVDVQIITVNKERTLTVPYSALIEKKKKYYVFVESNNTAVLREVGIGSSDDQLVEITRGLNPNEMVLVNPPRTLLDKTKIRTTRT